MNIPLQELKIDQNDAHVVNAICRFLLADKVCFLSFNPMNAIYIYIEEILILTIILEIRQELINNIANEIIIIFLIQETNTAYTK